jgi:hypothetical protein
LVSVSEGIETGPEARKSVRRKTVTELPQGR